MAFKYLSCMALFALGLANPAKADTSAQTHAASNTAIPVDGLEHISAVVDTAMVHGVLVVPPPFPAALLADGGDIVVTARPRHVPGDPLQSVNAKAFAVTQVADDAVVAPASRVYVHAVPTPVRDGLRNFLNNLHEPVASIAFLLQMKPGKSAETLGRFAINTTVGAAGLFDIAKRKPFHLPRRRNGFANTLGYYGVKPGPFLFLPLIGPTTVRDLFGGAVDGFVLPTAVGPPFGSPAFTVPTGVIRGLDRRAVLNGQLETQRTESSDPYAARRANYLKRRQAEIDALRNPKLVSSE